MKKTSFERQENKNEIQLSKPMFTFKVTIERYQLGQKCNQCRERERERVREVQRTTRTKGSSYKR